MEYKNIENINFIISFFKGKGYPINFICGLLGNIWTESAGSFNPNQVQLSYLRNKSYNISSCDDYVRMVNDGSWVDPSGRWFGEDRVGFGLTQLTSVGRKTGFYEYCKNKELSVADLTAQCEWIDIEIYSTGYANVRKAITNNYSIEECARVICTDFERPAGKNNPTKQQVRIDHALQIYDDFFKNKEKSEMNFELKSCILTNNDCYKDNWKMNPVGIVVHSTGCNNPSLRRYVQPDDGILGVNKNGNHWNRSGLNVCVHAFIGKDASGKVRCYQTLPFTVACWGVSRGRKGSYNYPATKSYPNDKPFIQFEMCEDGLADETYFSEVMDCAQKFCAYLMKLFPNITIENVVSHHESYLRQMGSNHADCDHWLKKFGKDMNWFRSGVLSALNGSYSDVAEKVDEVVAEKETVVEKAEVKTVTYVIKKGDTLGAIAKRFGVTLVEISKNNPDITNLNRIYVGQEIKIPQVQKTYTVVSGDTLSKIGKAYGIAWKEIATANNLSWPYVIHKGDVLVIPSLN